MNGEQVKPRSFKEKWVQIMDSYLKKLDPQNVQDYNEQVMLGLFGEKLVDLLNEEAEKTRKLMEGSGTLLSELMDHAEVLKDQLEKLRADSEPPAEEEPTESPAEEETENVNPE